MGENLMGALRMRFRVVLLALCALALLPASAQAAKTIDGDQLDIHLGDLGNVQVLALGQSSYSFYPEDETGGSPGKGKSKAKRGKKGKARGTFRKPKAGKRGKKAKASAGPALRLEPSPRRVGRSGPAGRGI
jgi:hypothetical protein